MRRAIVVLSLLTAAACSSAQGVASPSPAPQFQLNGIRTSASGQVVVTPSGDSTTLELKITGLAAFSAHASHVLSGSCQQQGGMVDPLNQVVADANGAADVKTTIQVHYPPSSGSWYVVVRAGPDTQGANADYLLCGNLSSAASPSPGASPSASGLQFPLNGIKTTASGKILVTSSGNSTTIELQITGLAPNSSHVSHVHSGTCTAQGGILFALNQVVADGTGAADTRTTIQTHYPPATGHWYVVVHAGPDMQGANATYLMCGDLS